jgi:hypothetical protein
LADSTTDKFAIYLYYFVVFLGKVCLMEGEYYTYCFALKKMPDVILYLKAMDNDFVFLQLLKWRA